MTGKETGLSRNLPAQSLIWISFLLTLAYLSKQEFDCRGRAHRTVEICLSQFKEQTGDCIEQASKIFLDVMIEMFPARILWGSIVWERRRQDYGLIFRNSRQFPVSRYSILNW